MLATIVLLSPGSIFAQSWTKDFVEVGNCTTQTALDYREHINTLVKRGELSEKSVEESAEREIGKLQRSANIDDHMCVILKSVYDEYGLEFK